MLPYNYTFGIPLQYTWTPSYPPLQKCAKRGCKIMNPQGVTFCGLHKKVNIQN